MEHVYSRGAARDNLGPVADSQITNAATSIVVDIATLTSGLPYYRLKALSPQHVKPLPTGSTAIADGLLIEQAI